MVFNPFQGCTYPHQTARIFCFLLALLVTTGALLSPPEVTSQVYRPAYLGVMLGFFLLLGLTERELRSQGWRFLVIGLGLLFLGALGSALVEVHAFNWDLDQEGRERLATVLEHGLGNLLGFAVMSFGLLLWIPEIVRSRQILKQNLATIEADQKKTSDKLAKSMRALDRANDNLIQAERLAAVGELAAGIAHDLRNPLAIIRSASQACIGGSRTPEEMKRTMEVIKRSVDKADRTIKNLMEMGRPATFEPTEVEADLLVEETLSLAAVEAAKAGVELEQTTPSGASLWGDRDLLGQALLNLCLNAIHATPPGGLVRVGARPFSLAGQRPVALFVEDTGMGLDPDIMGRIFDPFFTTKRNGTGLGLTMSQRVSARHGGKLDLRPRTSGGTRAVMLLPPVSRVPAEVPV